MEENKEIKKEEVQVESRIEEIKEVKNDIKGLENIEAIRSLLADNKMEFEYKEETYRVRKPNFIEKQEVFKLRCQRTVELLQETNADGTFVNLGGQDLKELYKKRGINIDKMDKSIKQFQIKENQLLEKLGKNVKDLAPDNQLKSYQEEIEIVRDAAQIILTEKASLLEFSIENQLLLFIYNRFTSIVTEKKVSEEGKEDKWIKAWNNFEEFSNGEEELINLSSTYLSLILNEQTV